jgi:hypothetical protein
MRIYNCRRYTNRACFIAGTQIITGQKTFSEDIIVGSVSQVYTQISTNSIDVHTGDDYCLRSHHLVHTAYEISWDA